jgi:hypothetical protein
MKYKLIERFLNQHFPKIDSVLLFGSYIKNPEKANDIDLILLSNNFASPSRESYLFENIKFNPIKLNPSSIFDILSRDYQQGDFYRIIFQEGISLVDKNKDIDFIKKYIASSYPKTRQNDLALGLNNILQKLTENTIFLENELPLVEFYLIAVETISCVIDFFLVTKEIYPNKSEKLKSRYLNLNLPIEHERIRRLIKQLQDNNQNEFYSELLILIHDYNIPIDSKYSNDLILDDYSQPQLFLFIENLFNFQDIKAIIDNIKSENINFFMYQVDEDNPEKSGCYIVFDNTHQIIEKNKQYWINFIKINFSKYQYTFPYNNIFCFPEIKFMGKVNDQLVNKILTIAVKVIHENKFTKEAFIAFFIKTYLDKSKINLDDLHHFYLGKLNAKSRSSNYSNNKIKETENIFLGTNKLAENQLTTIFKNFINITITLRLDFKVINNAPIWLHFQVFDRLISLFLKNDFEKLFYMNCYKKSLHE